MTQQKPYASCSYCGSSVDEQHVRTELWIGEQLVVFEHVPVGVCVNCGEEYFRADIHDKMLSLAKEHTHKTMVVPIHSFTDPLTLAKAKARKKKEHEAEPREVEMQIASEDEIRELSELSDQEDGDEF